MKVSAKSSSGIGTGDGTLVTLTFEVIAVKASTLRLCNVSLMDSDGFLIKPKIEGAQVGR